jgi:[acyl-carrier-protein] S-malonyltransferase
MASAAAGMRTVLAGVAFHEPRVRLLANADARPLVTGEACRVELVDHLTTGVDWIAAVDAMRSAGVTRFVEVGPGRVLSGLIRRIAPDAETIPLDDPGAPGGLADPDPAAGG